MGSIAKEQAKIKVIKGGMGITVKGQRGKWYGVQLPKRQRGDIKRFSAQSRARLRDTLAMAQPLNELWKPYGVCLTIPGRILSAAEVRRLWHEWVSNYWKRKFSMPMVWRIELQERKQAHWHIIAWSNNQEKLAIMALEWRRLVRRRFGPFDFKTELGFDSHGVDIRSLEGASSTGIIGYLCDHTSKHKQAQLGWQGRQWGVVNRDMLLWDGETVAELSEDEHIKAARQFRRLQDNLRKRGGKYTGVRVAPNGDVSTAIFGNDEARFLACVKLATKGGGSNGKATPGS